MPVQPYLISNVRTGLDRSMEPWLIPEDAYPDLEDSYMFRGRIQRRRGFLSLGRLVTHIAGEATGTVVNPWTSFNGTLANGDVSPGSVSISAGGITWLDTGREFGTQTGALATSPASANTGTINYITGVFSLVISPAFVGNQAVTATYDFYPRNPVMGLRTRELTTLNKKQLIGFDIVKANAFSNTTLSFQDISFFKTTGTAFSWSGTNSNFFWTVNYLRAFWATNSVEGFQDTGTSPTGGRGDGLRWYDGTGWVNFLPKVDASNFLMGSLLMFSYRNRLLMLNTTEGSAIGAFNNFPQRARWCQNGTPYPNTDPLGNVLPVPSGFAGGKDDTAWRSDQVGKGGFIDAPTSEQIVSAEFYKDTLIVFFERSTWQLRYTGNETLPFIWERINVELGGESTFSIVPFDAGIVSVGNYGIVSCDATGVKRIDQVIPDEVFDFHNGNDGPKRVYGIRDYAQQLVYWTFPNSASNPTFPNRVLIYNYLDGSYSFFNDSLTCFGTYQAFNDTTWANLSNVKWSNYPYAWNAAELQSDYPQIVAGNQQGFVFKNYNAGSITNNPSLVITSVTQANPAVITSTNHNLSDGTIIKIENVNGMTQLNNNIYRVSLPASSTFKIQTLDSNGNWINVDSSSFGAYTSGGLITVRNNFRVVTKRFNPFISEGKQLRLQNVDLFLEEASTTAFTMNVYLDENPNTSLETDIVNPNSTILGKVWVRSYTSVIGQFVQLEFTFDSEQIIDPTLSDGDIVIHAMMLWMSDSGRLTYGSNT